MVSSKKRNIAGKRWVPFFCIILLSLAWSDEIKCQEKIRSDVPTLRERLFFGGNFGLQFGSVTDIDISPVAGLWLLPRINAAAGPKYRFFKDAYGSTGIYGVRAYSEFYFIQNLNNIIPVGLNFGFFVHVEDELLSLEASFWQNYYSSGRIVRNTVLAGIGMSQPIGKKSSLNLMALWPLNDSFSDLFYTLYGNPEIRFSIIF